MARVAEKNVKGCTTSITFKELTPNSRVGDNQNASIEGFRMWEKTFKPTDGHAFDKFDKAILQKRKFR